VANAADIVHKYLSAFYGGDLQTARQYLADDMSFSGPAATFAGADAYLRATQHVMHAVNGVEKRKVFVDGPDVCVIYDLLIDHPVASIAIADWYHVESDRIASIRTILDTGPFTPTAGETALDPVCRMTVGKASAAATRTYAGDRYYFCSTGCAEAFDSQPEQYVIAAA